MQKKKRKKKQHKKSIKILEIVFTVARVLDS